MYSVTIVSRPHDSQLMSQGASALTISFVFPRLFEMTISHLYHLAQTHQVSCDLQPEVSQGDSLTE